MTRRSGLGRGLDALLPSGPDPAASPAAGPYREIEPERIDPNPDQPRRSFDDESLDQLAASIESIGVLQPLLVRPASGDRYVLVAGERRWRAAKRAGIDVVPVLVIDTDDRGARERALVENIHRKDLDPIEEAAAYKQLIDEGGLTQEALGERLGRSRSAIANSLRLLELPPDIQRFLIEGRLTARHGRALLSLQGNPFQARLASRAAHEGLSVGEVEELVRRYQRVTTPRATAGVPAEPPLVARERERLLSEHLQTRVRIDLGKRKGRIVIDVSSPEEVERLVDIMMGRRPGAVTSVASIEDRTPHQH